MKIRNGYSNNFLSLKIIQWIITYGRNIYKVILTQAYRQILNVFTIKHSEISVSVTANINKNQINFTIYNFSILKSIRHISIELFEEN